LDRTHRSAAARERRARVSRTTHGATATWRRATLAVAVSASTMTLHAAATYRAPVACRATTPTPTRRRATTTRRATRTRAAADPMAVEDGTIDLVVSTEAAKKTLQFDKVTVNEAEGPVIFVTGVAIGSEAEAAGVTPGQRLVAVSDPINDGELWFLDGSERLAFVLDAIRSAQNRPETTIIVETEVSITKELVDRARGVDTEEEARAAAAKAKAADAAAAPRREVTAADLAPRGSSPPGASDKPREKPREREDLYSDKWAGDEYVGEGFWNELTVGAAIFVAVPAVIVTLAVTTRGTLWDTTGF